MITTGDEKTEKRMGELDLRRSQSAGGGIAPMSRTSESVAHILAELTVHAIDLARNRRQPESRTSRLPTVKAIAFEGLDDLYLSRQGDRAKAEGERSEKRRLHDIK